MSSRAVVALVVAVTVGLAVGVGGYTFVYAKGASYLTDDPGACGNCHVMREHLDGWVKSSHRTAAVCNDCHTPPGLVAKYATKASNGFWHSFAFTTGRFPDTIRITPRNRAIAERACRKCHAAVVQGIDVAPRPHAALACLGCHGAVGHP